MKNILLLCGGLCFGIVYLGGCGTTASSMSVSGGIVSPTQNAQVARYSISAPAGASVRIQFGPTTAYGLNTWWQPAPAGGGLLSIYVAGMRANTTYHMQAIVQLANGRQVVDADHTFTTGSLDPRLPNVAASTTTGMTPQSGLEMLDLVNSNYRQSLVTDLSGNVLWAYQYGNVGTDLPEPVKLLPNGDFLISLAPQINASGLFSAGAINELREVDLAGITVRKLSVSDLNFRLAAKGFDLPVYMMHHDVITLPNGHWIVLVNTLKLFTNLPGFPGELNVLGDAIVDLDQNWEPVWVWNAFDHLDINRRPMNFPDWTHANALLYSPDDGNLLLSIRHQNWIVKIDYADGHGSGNLLWRLGEGGDFTLRGGVDPTDWFYAQHGPSFVGPSSAGNFALAVFDNGNDRQFPAGTTCSATGAASCPYSKAMVLQIDEAAKTASIQFDDRGIGFSVFGGNAEVLANGNLEFDMCDLSQSPNLARVYEVTQQANPQTVWQMNISDNFAYRAFRIPSLYPGVQW